MVIFPASSIVCCASGSLDLAVVYSWRNIGWIGWDAGENSMKLKDITLGMSIALVSSYSPIYIHCTIIIASELIITFTTNGENCTTELQMNLN